jgi:hypothetical protein
MPALWRNALRCSALRRCAHRVRSSRKSPQSRVISGARWAERRDDGAGWQIRAISRFGQLCSLLARFAFPVPAPGIAAQVFASPVGIRPEGERIVKIPCEQGFHGAGNATTPHGQGWSGLAGASRDSPSPPVPRASAPRLPLSPTHSAYRRPRSGRLRSPRRRRPSDCGRSPGAARRRCRGRVLPCRG